MLLRIVSVVAILVAYNGDFDTLCVGRVCRVFVVWGDIQVLCKLREFGKHDWGVIPRTSDVAPEP